MRVLRAAAVASIIVGPALFIKRRQEELSKVAPELRNPLLLLPMSVTNDTAMRLMRKYGIRKSQAEPGVHVQQRSIAFDGRSIDVYLYEPEGRQTPSGALLWIHGGGRVLGNPVSDHHICSFLARGAGVLVVSLDYRLAPEHPFPAALDDIAAVLDWMRSQARDLAIDVDRIAVGGASAGGGLAAEMCQRARDEGTEIAFQLLEYPMLDDRTIHPDPDGRGKFVWTVASNRYSWSSYLGHPAGDAETRPHAVAARADDLRGLPPAWIGVGELDLFYREDVEYAERLRAAGVACDVHIEPGMYHGADLVPGEQPASMRDFWQRMADALRSGVGDVD